MSKDVTPELVRLVATDVDNMGHSRIMYSYTLAHIHIHIHIGTHTCEANASTHMRKHINACVLIPINTQHAQTSTYMHKHTGIHIGT